MVSDETHCGSAKTLRCFIEVPRSRLAVELAKPSAARSYPWRHVKDTNPKVQPWTISTE